MYHIVKDVDQYSSFLPYCTASRVTKRISDSEMEADLEIGFRIFTERYTSRVTLDEPNRVTATCIRSSIFNHMVSTWSFEDVSSSPSSSSSKPSSWISFQIDFEVGSELHAQAVNIFFSQVAEQQISAFTSRALKAYNEERRVDYDREMSSETGNKSSQEATVSSSQASSNTVTTSSSSASSETLSVGVDTQAQCHLNIAGGSRTTHRNCVTGLSLSQMFTEAEQQLVYDRFSKYASTPPFSSFSTNNTGGEATLFITKEGFKSLIEELQHKNVLFSRYRDRYMLKTMVQQKTVLDSIFNGIEGASSGYVSFENMLFHLYFFTKSEPVERFAHFFEAYGSFDESGRTISSDQTRELTRQYFRMRFQVIRHVLPDMIFNHWKNASAAHEEDNVTTGIKTLAMLGLMEDVIDELNKELEQVLISKESFLIENERVDPKQYLQMWEGEDELLGMMSVVGVASVINWAVALDSPDIVSNSSFAPK